MLTRPKPLNGCKMLEKRILDVELQFELLINKSPELSVFRRNASTWELLLRMAAEEDGMIEGLYNAIEQLETQYLGSSAMLKFIREHREDGLLEFRKHTKLSTWRLSLKPSVREELLALLQWRDNQLRELKNS